MVADRHLLAQQGMNVVAGWTTPPGPGLIGGTHGRVGKCIVDGHERRQVQITPVSSSIHAAVVVGSPAATHV